jgi:hypothetical protein
MAYPPIAILFHAFLGHVSGPHSSGRSAGDEEESQ